MGRQKRAYQSVTIRDVAERAGVAVSTVSRVLNGLDRVSEETRRRVEQAARELSYVPNNFAASMVTGQSRDPRHYRAELHARLLRLHRTDGRACVPQAWLSHHRLCQRRGPGRRPRRLPAALLPHARRRAPRADGRAPEGPRVL